MVQNQKYDKEEETEEYEEEEKEPQEQDEIDDLVNRRSASLTRKRFNGWLQCKTEEWIFQQPEWYAHHLGSVSKQYVST